MAILKPEYCTSEIPAIREAATAAGAQSALHSMVRSPGGSAPVFENWLYKDVSFQPNETIVVRILTRPSRSEAGRIELDF